VFFFLPFYKTQLKWICFRESRFAGIGSAEQVRGSKARRKSGECCWAGRVCTALFPQRVPIASAALWRGRRYRGGSWNCNLEGSNQVYLE